METSELHSLFLSSTGVQIDSRTLKPGCLFFALRGDRFDGHAFVDQALEQGAMAVVVDRAEYANGPNRILVADVLKALQELASYHRQSWGKTVVGLTGSNGKTTAKELFARVAGSSLSVWATQGNLNNHIGVPLTLLQLKPEHDVAVVEMGANHQREIHELAGMARPNLGYITNYGKAHLEGFGGIEGVIKGKSELYHRLREWNGTALVNANDDEQLRQSEGLDRYTFAEKGTSGLPVDVEYIPQPADEQGFSRIEARGTNVGSHLTGTFQNTHLAAAMALGQWLNLPADRCADSIASYVPQNNRAEWRETDKNRVLLDAYNANPSSTLASLQAFALRSDLKKPLVILGDMFELGEWAATEHQAILYWLAQEAPHLDVWTVGAHYAGCKAHGATRTFSSTEEAREALQKASFAGRTVLIKGSRGMALEALLPAL